jgi:multiple antibiotic resistance protein
MRAPASHRRRASDRDLPRGSRTGRVTELFVSAFVTLFVVIDPPGCAPIFAGLTRGAEGAQRRSMAIKSVVIASLILLFFALLGEGLLQLLGITLAAFRIAGGIMLFLIALEMVFERRTARREERAQEVSTSGRHDDISVFPMAMPMIAGPGSIASVMLLMARSRGTEETLVVLAALAVNLLLTLIALIAAGTMLRIVGRKVEATITRLLGVILAALAVQFVIDGIGVSFNV